MASPNGTAKYGSKVNRDMSIPNLRTLFLGIIRFFSSATRKRGGTKMVIHRKILLIAVYITAVLAQIFDFP